MQEIFQSSYIGESIWQVIKVLRQNFISEKVNLQAGGAYVNTSHYNVTVNANFWSTIYESHENAYYINFYSNIIHLIDGNRDSGHSIRAIQ